MLHRSNNNNLPSKWTITATSHPVLAAIRCWSNNSRRSSSNSSYKHSSNNSWTSRCRKACNSNNLYRSNSSNSNYYNNNSSNSSSNNNNNSNNNYSRCIIRLPSRSSVVSSKPSFNNMLPVSPTTPKVVETSRPLRKIVASNHRPLYTKKQTTTITTITNELGDDRWCKYTPAVKLQNYQNLRCESDWDWTYRIRAKFYYAALMH